MDPFVAPEQTLARKSVERFAGQNVRANSKKLFARHGKTSKGFKATR